MQLVMLVVADGFLFVDAGNIIGNVHSSLWDRFSWNCDILFGMLTPVLVEGFLRWLIQKATIDIANLRIRRF